MKQFVQLFIGFMLIFSVLLMATLENASAVEIGVFESEKPETMVESLAYKQYVLGEHYVVSLKGTVSVRKTPTAKGVVLKLLRGNEKMSASEAVEGDVLSKDNPIWYKVSYALKGKRVEGFVYSGSVEKRQFDYKKMIETSDFIRTAVDNGTVGFIDNYRGRKGTAPKYQGNQTVDAFGVRQYQSAPAYYEESLKSDFRYLQDGRMLIILSAVGDLWEVQVPDASESFFVPKKFIRYETRMKTLKQVIVVDRKQQNLCLFEATPTGWDLISRQMATTGADDKYRMPTDLGAFLIMEKKERFKYADDETKLISGYAPYALRFNGGAYIHGVPVDFNKDGSDPGLTEYMSSIGTVPKSHKCIRNFTSHAKFLYDRIQVGQAVVIIIE